MKNSIGSFTAKAAAFLLAFGCAVSAWGATTQVATSAALTDAVSAASPGDTIQLTADVTLSATLEITKSITLDLNGKTLTKSLESTSDKTPVIKALSGTVEIANGTITYDLSTYTGTTGTSYANVIYLGMSMSNGVYSYGDCNLTLNGVNVSVTFPSGKASMTMVYVESGRLNIVDSNLSATTGASNTKTQYMIYTTAHASAVVDPYVSITGTTTIDTNGKPGIHAIWLQGSKDTLIISGNAVTINAEAEWKSASWSSTMSYAYAINNQSGATCTIEGGKFTGKVWATKGTITVYGGTFSYPQGTSGQKNKFTLAEGVEYVENTDPATKDAYPYVAAVSAPSVAQIVTNNGATTNKYESLAAAVAAASSGDTIELIADDDVSLTNGQEIEINKPLTITGPVDANGDPLYTIYGTPSNTGYNDVFVASSSGTVTISNLAFAEFGNEAANSVNGHAPIFVSSGNNNVVLENLVISDFNRTAIKINGGEFLVTNCLIDCSTDMENYRIGGVDVANAATGAFVGTTITDVGTSDPTTWVSAALELIGSGAIRVEDCEFTSAINGIFVSTADGTSPGSSAVTVVNTTVDADVYALINDSDSADAEIAVESGSYTGMLSAETETGLAISGGTFDDEIPEEYCADGYIPTDADPVTGLYTVMQGTYVAQIGDVKYASLAAAFEAAQSGDTVQLLKDCETGTAYTHATPLVFNTANATLDLNGKTLTITYNMSLIFRCNGGVVMNGTIVPGVTDSNVSGDWCRYGLTIDSCSGVTVSNVVSTTGIAVGGDPDGGYTPGAGPATDVVFTGCTVTGRTTRYAVMAQNQSTATIKDGTYNAYAANGNVLYSGFKPNDGGAGSLTVTGGSFMGAIPDSNIGAIVISGGIFSKQPVAGLLAPGYVVVANEDAETKVAYPYTVAGAVAQIVRNDAVVAQYASLAAAFEAAQSGDTVQLLTDCETGTAYTHATPLVFNTANATLDLNGKTLTITYNMSLVFRCNSGVVMNGSIVPGVTDSSVSGDWCRYGLTIDSCSGVTVSNVVSTTGIAVGGDPDGGYTPGAGPATDVVFTGCTVTGRTTRYAVMAQNQSTATIKDGTYSAYAANGNVLYSGFKPNDGGAGSLTVTGGSFMGAIPDSNVGAIVISGGIFSKQPVAGLLAQGCVVVANEDAETKVAYPYTVAGPVVAGFSASDMEASSETEAGGIVTVANGVVSTALSGVSDIRFIRAYSADGFVTLRTSDASNTFALPAGFGTVTKVVAYCGENVTATAGAVPSLFPQVDRAGDPPCATGSFAMKSGVYYSLEVNGVSKALHDNKPVAPEEDGDSLDYSVPVSPNPWGVVKFRIIVSDEPL